MKLVSLKEVLPQAPSASHRMAKKRHFRRAIVTCLIATSLAAGSITGISYWTSHKDKMERIKKNPYSIEAVTDRFPDKEHAYSVCNDYSRKIDSIARELMYDIYTNHRNDTLGRITRAETGEYRILDFKVADSLLVSFFVGGKNNPVNISKNDYTYVMRLFDSGFGTAAVFNIWSGSAYSHANELALRSSSTEFALKIDSMAANLQRVLDYSYSNMTSVEQTASVEQKISASPMTKKTLDVLEGGKKNFASLYNSLINKLIQYRLGKNHNPPSMTKEQFDSTVVKLAKLDWSVMATSKVLDRETEVLKSIYELLKK